MLNVTYLIFAATFACAQLQTELCQPEDVVDNRLNRQLLAIENRRTSKVALRNLVYLGSYHNNSEREW